MLRHVARVGIMGALGCGATAEPVTGDDTGSSTGTVAPTTSTMGAGPGEASSSSPTTGSETGGTDSGDPSDASSDGSTTGPPIELDCEGSVLADLVADLPSRTWVTMPEHAGLDALEMASSLLYWNDSGVWDPNRRRLQWVGGPGTCCADPAQYRRIAYDELTDTWTIEDTPFAGSGHAYDGNAMDPETGVHYFSMFSDQEVKRYDGDTWDALPAIPFDAQATSGLTWFEALGGLVYVGGYGDVAWFDGSAWAQLPGAEDAPWGSYNTFAEQSARHELAWVGAGNGGEDVSYLIDASGELTRAADAPISLNNGQTLKSVDPIGGNFLVGAPESGAWWEYDPIADAWTEIVDMADEPDMSSYAVFHVPLPHCGVTAFFGHYYEHRDVWLYRHSPA
jgi:hypothetical protein